MEHKIDVANPNLHIRDYDTQIGRGFGLLYSLERLEDVLKSARVVNDVVKRYVNENGLKVRESDFNIVNEQGEHEKSETYSFPLNKYLDVLNLRRSGGVTSKMSELFRLGHTIDASSYENHEELLKWSHLKRGLADPDKTFDEFEKDTFTRYDRVKTLDNMKGLFEELDAKIPDLFTKLGIFSVEYRNEASWIGFVSFSKLRGQDNEKVEAAKSELVEKLKEFRGLCLSLDAFGLYMQKARLYNDAGELVNSYGDILLNPNWQERFFRFDP
jgi:succinate dehydrogenase flavin-adding protein (antitoxin of CptAB toxin-antitoxin module)